MINLYFEMRLYARDHGGILPTSPDGPLAALQKLYPEYTHSGKELAGLTGDIDRVVAILKQGGTLGTNSSWVYNEGLKLTDPLELALFWEREAGVFPSGKRSPKAGHAVMLLSGTVTNVPLADWAKFINQQESLRRKSVNPKRG